MPKIQRHQIVATCILALLSAFAACYMSAITAAALTDQFVGASPRIAWEAWSAFSIDNKTFRLVLALCSAAFILVFLTATFAIFEDKKSLHGDAKFATSRELNDGGLFAKKGIILAKFGGKYLVFEGQEFVLVAAPTRSGKGVSIVIPNLLNWQESVVVLDVKKENFLMTSGWRQKVLKQDVYLFDPFDSSGKTSRWNPLDSVSKDPNLMVADVLQIAQIFYPSNPSDKNRFFQDTAQNLFLGLTLFLIETRHPRITIGEVFRQGSGYGRPIVDYLKDLLETHKNLSYACSGALSRVVSAPGETLGNIKATFDAALLVFSIPTVDWATSATDFNVSQIMRQKMSVYFGVSVDKITLVQRLINLFFTQLINLNTRVLPEDDPTLKYQCLVINDEFTAPGRLDVILKGVAFIAGYNLRLLTIIQSTSQLKNPELYGREGAETLLANHAVRVIFPPTTEQEAKDYSEMLGTYTMTATSKSSSRSGKGIISLNESVSAGSNTSDQKRALLMPQELKRLKKDAVIVEKQGVNPAKATKAYYYQDANFLKRLGDISPALEMILRSRKPTEDEIKSIRVLGEFSAHLQTKPFDPFTHASPPLLAPAGTTQPTKSLLNAITPETTISETGLTPSQAKSAANFSLEQAGDLLASRIPEFTSAATVEDWLDIVFKEASSLFPLINDQPGATS